MALTRKLDKLQFDKNMIKMLGKSNSTMQLVPSFPNLGLAPRTQHESSSNPTNLVPG